MSDDDLRRLIFLPPRHRPGIFAVAVRWRVELLALVALLGLWHLVGGHVLAVASLLALGLGCAVPAVRRVALGALQATVVPHRVRSGLVQAGVAARDGRLPWLVVAVPRRDAVRVTVWLRSGTTIRDLDRASPVLVAACGASVVTVESPSTRRDRAVVVVVEPRWGWWIS